MQFKGQIDFRIDEQDPEQVTGTMPIQSGILNPYGTVHAGAILWFADVIGSALAYGSASAEKGIEGFPLAVNISMNLAGNRTEGTFTARANFVKRGKLITIVRTIVTDQDDRLIADVTTNLVQSK